MNLLCAWFGDWPLSKYCMLLGRHSLVVKIEAIASATTNVAPIASFLRCAVAK